MGLHYLIPHGTACLNECGKTVLHVSAIFNINGSPARELHRESWIQFEIEFSTEQRRHETFVGLLSLHQGSNQATIVALRSEVHRPPKIILLHGSRVDNAHRAYKSNPDSEGHHRAVVCPFQRHSYRIVFETSLHRRNRLLGIVRNVNNIADHYFVREIHQCTPQITEKTFHYRIEIKKCRHFSPH